jgi:hypothetical protein
MDSDVKSIKNNASDPKLPDFVLHLTLPDQCVHEQVAH